MMEKMDLVSVSAAPSSASFQRFALECIPGRFASAFHRCMAETRTKSEKTDDANPANHHNGAPESLCFSRLPIRQASVCLRKTVFCIAKKLFEEDAPSAPFDISDEFSLRDARMFLSWQTKKTIALDLAGYPACFPMPSFWPLVSAMAWQDPEFQVVMARLVQKYLWGRTVLVLRSRPDTGFDRKTGPGFASRNPEWVLEKPEAVFHENTCWTLLFFAEIKAKHFFQRLSPFFIIRLLALRRLKKCAREHFLRPGWADFWDQWMFWEIKGKHPEKYKRIDKKLYMGLEKLPLIRLAEGPRKKEKATGKRVRLLNWIRSLRTKKAFYGAYSGSWKANAPEWMRQFVPALKE